MVGVTSGDGKRDGFHLNDICGNLHSQVTSALEIPSAFPKNGKRTPTPLILNHRERRGRRIKKFSELSVLSGLKGWGGLLPVPRSQFPTPKRGPLTFDLRQ